MPVRLGLTSTLEQLVYYRALGPAMKTAIAIAGPTDLNIPFSLNCNSVVILTMHMDLFCGRKSRLLYLLTLLRFQDLLIA